MRKGEVHLAYWNVLGRFSDWNNVFSVAIDHPQLRREIITLTGLTPNKQDRNDFKYNGDSWDNFRDKYVEKLSSDPQSKLDIDRVTKLLDDGQDVVLTCWEKYMPCHRFIIGQILFSLGYKVYWYDGMLQYEYEDQMYKYEKGIIDPKFVKMKRELKKEDE